MSKTLVISYPDTADLASLAKGNTVSISNDTDSIAGGTIVHIGDTLDQTPEVVDHTHPGGPVGPAVPA